MSETETTSNDRPTEVDTYLRHRSRYRDANPYPPVGAPDLVDRYRARVEIVPLALTIADLTEHASCEHGAYCARTDPTGQDDTYEEEHGTTWGERAVREALAPALTALRGVEAALDDVDAVRLDPALIDRLFREAAPEVALNSLAGVLRNQRDAALKQYGLTHAVLNTYLAYRHLPMTHHRVLYVKPSTPWDYAGVALASALYAYAGQSPQRFKEAEACVKRHRDQNAKDLPPSHWNW